MMNFGNYICKIASTEEMEQKWNYEISQHSEKENWIVWKSEAMGKSSEQIDIGWTGNGKIRRMNVQWIRFDLSGGKAVCCKNC